MPYQRIIVILILAAILAGANYAWHDRQNMNPDGINYLDMADAIRQGDWKAAINACWSPLYPCLLGLALSMLKPSLSWEFPVVHIVDFTIYLLALSCFQFFLSALLNYRKEQTDKAKNEERIFLPDWSLLLLGYSLFLWSSLTLISISLATPDMLVSAFVYLAAGILLRTKGKNASWPAFLFLGLTLGFGYLVKAVFFPIAVFFLATGFFYAGKRKRAVWMMLLATVSFLLTASPLIASLSIAKGYLTFTESYSPLCGGLSCQGKLIAVHKWQEEASCTGTPLHPRREIFDQPKIFEFGAPIKATYPIGYDLAYWNEGVSCKNPDLLQLLGVLKENAKEYFYLFFPSQSALICGLLILFLLNSLRRTWKKDIKPYLILLIPVLLVLFMYMLVRVAGRYVGEFFVIFWLCIFTAFRLPYSEQLKKLPEFIACAMAIPLLMPIFFRSTHYLLEGTNRPPEHVEVAHILRQQGIKPNDEIATIGSGTHSWYWARLARVRIIAEVPDCEEIKFWVADDTRKSRIYKTLSEAGAKIAVGKNAVYGSLKGWQRIGETDYYFFLLTE